MPLNIIVKRGSEARWDKVVEVIHQRENGRREFLNHGGTHEFARRTQRVIESLRPEMQGKVFVVDRKIDGFLMDQARERVGHTDWRRDGEFLKWLKRQPEMAGFV